MRWTIGRPDCSERSPLKNQPRFKHEFPSKNCDSHDQRLRQRSYRYFRGYTSVIINYVIHTRDWKTEWAEQSGGPIVRSAVLNEIKSWFPFVTGITNLQVWPDNKTNLRDWATECAEQSGGPIVRSAVPLKNQPRFKHEFPLQNCASHEQRLRQRLQQRLRQWSWSLSGNSSWQPAVQQ